jgi:hypothetical protein
MSFDFYSQYAGFSNVELLKIVQRPGDYDSTAVKAAEALLGERSVSKEESLKVQQYYQEIDEKHKAKQDRLHSLNAIIEDFLEPILKPSEEILPYKWIRILLLVLTIQYLFELYKSIRIFIAFFNCIDCSFDVYLFTSLISIAFTPLLIYLLIKRNEWGWILLFGSQVFNLIAGLGQTDIFFRYYYPLNPDISSWLLPLLVNSAFVFFLWKPSLSGYFEIDNETRKKTAIVAVSLAIIFSIGLRLT